MNKYKNTYITIDNTIIINCFSCKGDFNGSITIDKEDFEKVKEYQWHIEHSRKNLNYGAASVKGRTIRIHRLILPDSIQIDHINHDGLDNRKSNLRPCTNAENNRNKRTNFNPKSGAIGVRKIRDRYFARIMVNKKEISLGGFATLEEAIEARRLAEVKYFKDFKFDESITGTVTRGL